MQVNALRYLEQHYKLCDSKGYETRTCEFIINCILAQVAVRKDPSLHDRIIKSFKHFQRRRQFKLIDKNRSNKWKPRLPEKEMRAFPNYKIHQALIEMFDKDSTYPSPDDDTPQKMNQLSITEEQEKINYYIHQIID